MKKSIPRQYQHPGQKLIFIVLFFLNQNCSETEVSEQQPLKNDLFNNQPGC
jgi:hypothetical protein